MEGLLLSAIEQENYWVQKGLLGHGHQAECLQHGHDHQLSITSSYREHNVESID